MKKIIFIPTYIYLSTPILEKLVDKFKNYETIYLDTEDEYNNNKNSQEFRKKFTKVIDFSHYFSYENNLIKLIKMIKLQYKIKKFLEEEKPSVIITTSDLSFSVRIIKKFFPDIKIIIVQSALFTNNTFPISKFQKIKYFIFNKICNLPIVQRQNHFANEYRDTYILLWGEYFKKFLSEEHQKEKIKIIGDITLDKFPIDKNNKLKKEILVKNNFSLNSNIITVCTGAYGNLVSKKLLNNLYEIYFEIIERCNDTFFIIKPHPREKNNILINKVSNFKNVIISNENLYEIFQYTDIHISSFSRTALEALASNIPIVTINPNNQIGLEDFFNNELDEKAINLEEAIEKIDNILVKKGDFFNLREKYIKKMFYKLDGSANKRAVEEIEKILLETEDG